ncbi:uncharacterized protein LOC135938525 [Cloeon dipterum]|uniref:uncharacterized protein LOC135938525 n=1 Tax=Cloeon dipterum TaxID=197152 RepID=UPI00322007CF
MAKVYMSAAFEGNSYVGDGTSFGDDDDDEHPPEKSDGDDEDSWDEDDGDDEVDVELSDDDKIDCPFCSNFNCQRDDVARHVSIVHPRSCLRCRITLETDDEYERHVQQHEQSFSCNLCDEQFTDEAEFEFHRMSDHGAQRCKYCSAVVVEGEMEPHLRHCRGKRKQVLRPTRMDHTKMDPKVHSMRTRRGGVLGRPCKRRKRTPPPPVETEGLSIEEIKRRRQKGELEKTRRDNLVSEFKRIMKLLPRLHTEERRKNCTKMEILGEAVNQIKRLEEQSHTYHKMKLLLTRQKQRLEQREEELKKMPDAN